MVITDLKYRAQNQSEIGNKIVLNKLVDKMIQVKKQYLFEISMLSQSLKDDSRLISPAEKSSEPPPPFAV